MSPITLTIPTNKNGFGKRKRTIRNKIIIGRVALGFITIYLVCSFGLFYLIQANKVATKGYEICHYEEKIKELQRTNQKLKLEAAELQSVYRLREARKKFNLVEITKVSYMRKGEREFVKK